MPLFLAICMLLMLPFNAIGETRKKAVDELHQTSSSNIARIFVEDVTSLLPDDFKKNLDIEAIVSAVKFRNYSNKWQQYSVISENDLVNMYNKIASGYVNNKMNRLQLSDELGNTVTMIVGASMVNGNNDLLGERFKQNMNSFVKDEPTKKHLIEYGGYDGCSIRTCIAQIYELSKYSKTNIYPLMVTRTASLWSAVHNAKANNTQKVAKTILRQPFNIDLTGLHNTNRSSYNRIVSGSSAASGQSPGQSNGYSGNDEEPPYIILIPMR